MRNIKITALLLAVLMVVSAFAGCASSSDLENKVNEQANAIAGIQDSIKDLADAIANQGSSSELDDIKADIAENKQDAAENKQNIADILEAINGLKDAVAGATGESEDVKTAINQAGAKIDALKEDYSDAKKHYIAEDYAAIVAALGAAQASISTCVTAEAVAAAVAAMETELAKYVRVDDSIYAYYVALTGNITAETADLLKEAQAELKAAKKFYNKAEIGEKKDGNYYGPLTAYEYDEDEETVDLIEWLDVDGKFDGSFDTLKKITKDAQGIVADIDKAIAGEEITRTLTQLRKDYNKFVRTAKELSEANVALVTNADKLDVLVEAAEKVNDAVAALNSELDGAYPSMLRTTYGESDDGKTFYGIFYDYETLAGKNNAQLTFVFKTMKNKKAAIGLTSTIYDAIDARLEKLAEDFDLSEEGLALVIEKYRNKDFLAKYEADKATVKAFEAEYEKLAEGVFADIAELAEAKLTVSSTSALVEQYKANADAINAWYDSMMNAYKALDKKAKIYGADSEYAKIVLANYQAMVVKAELVGWDNVSEDEDEVEWKHNPESTYAGKIDDAKHEDGKNDFYFDLYAFDTINSENYVDEDKVELGKFLESTFAEANKAAEKLNARIKDFKVAQAYSIIDLLVNIGGYYDNLELDKDGNYKKNDKDEVIFAPIEITDDNKDHPYTDTTIAGFIFKYKTDNYDLSGLIDVAAYNEKVAAVEAAVEAAEEALANLVAAYETLKGDNKGVVVTLDNADEIIKLEALQVLAKAAANVKVEKAVVVENKDGFNVYEIESVFADMLGEDQTVEEFYNIYLNSLDVEDTYNKDGAKQTTGVITMLVYQAKALKADAAVVESIYAVMKQLNDATAGKVFAYSTLKDANTLLTKMYASTASLALEGFWYGIGSLTTATKTNKDGVTEYQTSATAVRFNNDTGRFYMGTKAGDWNTDKNTSIRSAIDAVRSQWVYTLTVTDNADENVKAFNEQIHKTLVNSQYEDGKLVSLGLKDANRADLGKLFGNQNKFIPGYLLPMVATNLEAKFLINNMGKTTDAITAAKAGWGDTNDVYGFDYNKALTANLLREDAKLNSAELDTLGNAKDYSGLTRAILNINTDRAEGNKIAENIEFGVADITWLSPVYDATKTYYAAGAAVETDDYAKYYAAAKTADANKPDADIKKAYYKEAFGLTIADVEVITIWEAAPAVELQ